MRCEQRCPEGRKVDERALKLFSRVSAWMGRSAAWRVRRILGSALRKDMRILDIGTGPAAIPLQLKQLYPSTCFIGLDISLDMLVMASNHGKVDKVPLDFLAGDGQCLPFESNTLDVITSFFALHHMDHPEKFLLEMDRVLKSNGSLLIIDFRRDMSLGLFRLLDALWQIVFYFSAGRFGFRNSVHSAWHPNEIKSILSQNNISRFRVYTNRFELWIIGMKYDFFT